MGQLSVPYWMGDRLAGFDAPAGAAPIEAEVSGDTPMSRLAAVTSELAGRVAEVGRPVVWAADCASAIGVVGGMARAGVEPTVVWFDAHGDFNTWETTPSGFIGGMPLAMLAGRGEQTLMEAAGLEPLDEERLVLVGARDLDPGEIVALERSGVRRIGVEGVARHDFGDRPLYVHVDMDVVDPAHVPGLHYPADGGPDVVTVRAAVDHLLATGRVAGVCMACTWDHGHPDAGRAAAAARQVAARVGAG